MRAACAACIAAGAILRIAFHGRPLGILGTVLAFVALLVLVAYQREQGQNGEPSGTTPPRRRWRPGRALIPILLLIVAGFVAQRVIGSNDTRKVERTIERVATSGEPGYCEEAMTTAYLEQITDAEAALADDVCEQELPQSTADSVEVGDVRVDGDRATALVETSGSFEDGSIVHVTLVKEDGDWKLDHRDAYVRFDRASFEDGYRRSFSEFGSPSEATECAMRRIRGISDARLERLLLTDSGTVFATIAVECDRPGVERNMIHGVGGDEFGFSPRAIACAEERIAEMSDARLAAMWEDGTEFNAVLDGCDPRWLLRYVRHSLVEGGDTGRAAAECVVRELEAMPPRRAQRFVYEDDRYRELVERCEAANSGSGD